MEREEAAAKATDLTEAMNKLSVKMDADIAYGQRTRYLTRGLFILLGLLTLLSLVTGLLVLQVRSTTHTATKALDQAAVNCHVGNDARALNVNLWTTFLQPYVSNPVLPAAERQSAQRFLSEVDKVFAPIACPK